MGGRGKALVLAALLAAATGMVAWGIVRAIDSAGSPLDDDVPQFEVTAVEIDLSFRRRAKLRVAGIDEYLETYGEGGWVRGLSDTRSLDVPGEVQQVESGDSVGAFKVRDLFLLRYLKEEGDEDDLVGFRSAAWREDRAGEILRELRGE